MQAPCLVGCSLKPWRSCPAPSGSSTAESLDCICMPNKPYLQGPEHGNFDKPWSRHVWLPVSCRGDIISQGGAGSRGTVQGRRGGDVVGCAAPLESLKLRQPTLGPGILVSAQVELHSRLVSCKQRPGFPQNAFQVQVKPRAVDGHHPQILPESRRLQRLQEVDPFSDHCSQKRGHQRLFAVQE